MPSKTSRLQTVAELTFDLKKTPVPAGVFVPDDVIKKLGASEIQRLKNCGALVEVEVDVVEASSTEKPKSKAPTLTDQQVIEKILALDPSDDKNWTQGGPKDGEPQTSVLGCNAEQRTRAWDLAKSDYLELHAPANPEGTAASSNDDAGGTDPAGDGAV